MTDFHSLAPDSSIHSKIFFLVPIGTMSHLGRRSSAFTVACLCESAILVPIGTTPRILVTIRTMKEEKREAIFSAARGMLNLQMK